MAKQKKHKKEYIQEVETLDEAMNCGYICLKYFLKNHTMKTLLFLFVIFGFGGYVANDYLTSRRVNIEEAKPLQPQTHSSTFSIMPQAHAQDLAVHKNEIRVNGNYYGNMDTNYIAYVMENGENVFIYDKRTDYAIKVAIPRLRGDFKQQKKY